MFSQRFGGEKALAVVRSLVEMDVVRKRQHHFYCFIGEHHDSVHSSGHFSFRWNILHCFGSQGSDRLESTRLDSTRRDKMGKREKISNAGTVALSYVEFTREGERSCWWYLCFGERWLMGKICGRIQNESCFCCSQDFVCRICHKFADRVSQAAKSE